MSGRKQDESVVIAIEDDEDEDVEVLFSNLNKANVYRNLVRRKLSQEIELLQALKKTATVPNEYLKFRDLVKELGFQHSENVMQSAFQRIRKRHLMKFNSSLNNKNPIICLVRPLQTSPDKPSLPVVPTPSLPHPSVSLTSPDKPSLPEVPTPSLPHPSVSLTKPCHTGPMSSPAIPVALLMNSSVYGGNSEPVAENSTHCGDDNNKTDVVSVSEKIQSKIDIGSSCSNKVFSNKRKRDSDINCSDLYKQDFSENTSDESVETRSSFRGDSLGRDVVSVVPEQTPFNARKQGIQKSLQKKQSSSKKEVSVDSPKAANQKVAESHIGVKATILKTKQTSPKNYVNSLGKTISKTEFKKFKAEQKKLKLEQKRELEMQQLQKVHDRLVDVLIPKYYNKDLNEKG